MKQIRINKKNAFICFNQKQRVCKNILFELINFTTIASFYINGTNVLRDVIPNVGGKRKIYEIIKTCMMISEINENIAVKKLLIPLV